MRVGSGHYVREVNNQLRIYQVNLLGDVVKLDLIVWNLATLVLVQH